MQQGVVFCWIDDFPPAVLPLHSSVRISIKLMDVYFWGSAGVWLQASKRASLLDQEDSMLGIRWGFLEKHFKDSHKRWLCLCCQSSSCLEVCGPVEASQNSSNFRNTYPDVDLQGRCYFHLDNFPLALLPPSSVATVASVGAPFSTCKVPWDNSEQSQVSIPCD